MKKLRFHLASGKNFMKWQLTEADGKVSYFDPETTQFLLRGCQLRNRPAIAKKIYDGAVKSVCAWIDCQEVHVVSDIDVGQQIRFNPKAKPYWHVNWRHENIDNMIFNELVTSSNSVCLPA